MLVMVISMVAASLMSLSKTSMQLTKRNNNRVRNLYVAIAGVEKVKEDLNYYFKENGTASQEDLQSIYPPYEFYDHYFYDEDWMPGLVVNKTGDVEQREVASGNFQGMVAVSQNYDISSTCRDNFDSMANVTESVAINAIPLGQFAVFYEKDLEILPGPDFIIEGWVHSNGDMYVGSHNTLSFDSRITSVGNLFHRRKNDGSVMGGTVRIKDADGNYQSMRLPDGTGSLDSDHPDWAAQSITRWGDRVRNNVHGVPKLRLPIEVGEEPHDIIERADPSDSEQLSDIKFENKADLKIIDGVGYDAAGNIVPLTYPDPADPSNTKSIISTKSFYNYREGKTIQVTEIDVANLIESGVSIGDGVVYVSDTQPGGSNQAAVRLANGSQLPSGGMTLASDNPVYIQGDYNTVNQQASLVVGDAINVLSNSWDDANGNFGDRNASDTTVNTVVFTGNTETTPGNYNGGLENVLRFLEDWGNDTLTFRGSIIDMWYSEVATGDWSYGSPQYKAPTRDWRFDPFYLDPENQPPGIPLVYAVERLEFAHQY
jgi:hypothetical protein